MANTAKDYKICCALFGNAYIAKVSKRNPNQMLDDRRVITKSEIFTLIAWELDQFVTHNEGCDGFVFEGFEGKKIEVHYIEEKEADNEH